MLDGSQSPGLSDRIDSKGQKGLVDLCDDVRVADEVPNAKPGQAERLRHRAGDDHIREGWQQVVHGVPERRIDKLSVGLVDEDDDRRGNPFEQRPKFLG